MKTILVKAPTLPGLEGKNRCPKEGGTPFRWIGEEPVEVVDSGYYQRCLRLGMLELVKSEPAKKSAKKDDQE